VFSAVPSSDSGEAPQACIDHGFNTIARRTPSLLTSYTNLNACLYYAQGSRYLLPNFSCVLTLNSSSTDSSSSYQLFQQINFYSAHSETIWLKARRVYISHAWGVTSIADYAPGCASPCQQARQLQLDEVSTTVSAVTYSLSFQTFTRASLAN
jgi:hypothetical protein